MLRIWILTLLFALAACTTPAPPDPYTSNPYFETLHKTPLATGTSRFMFEGWAGPAIPVWAHVPEGADKTSAPIVFMMHGAKRGPDRYLSEWVTLAERYGFIVVAPEFSAEDFPTSRRYNLGYLFERGSTTPRPEASWTFSAIEPLFDEVVQELGSTEQDYIIYGHSAGSQFVHRFLYYKPDARVKRYIAANAGWYTLPDAAEPYPYGTTGAAIQEGAIKSALQKDVIVLLGDQDTDANHDSLRRTPEAMRQGAHRFARGIFFFRNGKEQADALGVDYGWRLAVVEGVAHQNGGMAKGAVAFID